MGALEFQRSSTKPSFAAARIESDAAYAMEEFVAELASAFLYADLSITPEIREDHASYIETWLTVLKDDKRAIFTALLMPAMRPNVSTVCSP